MTWAVGTAVGFLRATETINRGGRMRKIFKFLLVCLAVALIPLALAETLREKPVSAEAAAVYVASTGDDGNVGTSDAPFKTLDAALMEVEDGGTIVVKDTVTVSGWSAHGKTVTITGGTLDASALSRMIINDNVTFTNVTVKAPEIYANGNTLVMGENVTTSGSGVYLYGGGEEGSTLDSTNLTVLSGEYAYIFGGSHGASGNVATINHDTRLTVGGTTKAGYVFGGAYGSSDIFGTTYLKISGGNFEGAYGGNYITNAGNDVDFEITGGKFVQVFGASFKAYLTGTVNLRLLGGTVTRRVYGGCYNESSGTSFTTTGYVNGKIYLTIGGGANIDFSSSEPDEAIYARTRHKTEVNTETAILTFADETAYTKYESKLGAQDISGKILMGSLTAADEYHYYMYTSEGATMLQKCAYCRDFSATATMELDESVSLTYTGEAKEPVILTYSDNWVGDKPQIVYANNIEAGQATCSLTVGTTTAELHFVIIDMPTVLGGSVRLSDPSGLRFQSRVPAALKDSGATFGTLIIPKEVLGDAELTHAIDLVEDVIQTQWATSEVQMFNPGEYREGYEYFNAVLTGIPEAYYDAEIVARSYAYANGEYYYSETVTRSIAQVAALALEDGYKNSILYTYVDKASEDMVLELESEISLWEEMQEYQLTFTGNAKGYAVIWSSSDNDIVTVDENGYIRAGTKQGVAYVRVQLGSRIVECRVVVSRRWSKYY